MNDQTDQQLLRDYAERQSEAAFAAIVQRYVDLVYSAAFRMVCDAHAAKDVTQSVFVALAHSARQLTDRPALAGWLHGTARNLAAKVVRSEVRRRAREQEAAVMNQLLSANPDASWEHIAPHLDDALGELSEPDRDAVLLRYFKNHDLRTVGATLGISDDAAQKRVSRAVDRLRDFFAKRGFTVGASGLAVVISANAVQAAPVGLALTISTAAALTGTTLATTATVTATKAIAMTALQKTIITATIAVLAGVGIYEARQAAQLRDQIQTLQQQQAPLTEQIQQLQGERDDITSQLTALREDKEHLNRNSGQLLKLPSEITALQNHTQEATQGTMANLQKENDALRDKTNQLWHSLVGYMNAYSNSIPLDKRWAYSLEERKRFSLAQVQDGRYVLRRKGADGTDTLFYGGEFTSIGITDDHIFVRMPAHSDAPEGWKTIDLRSGAVNGIYGDTEFMERPEVRGVRFMNPTEAWEFIK